jgi:hypothetical protein
MANILFILVKLDRRYLKILWDRMLPRTLAEVAFLPNPTEISLSLDPRRCYEGELVWYGDRS